MPPMPPMPPADGNMGMPAMHIAFFWGHRAQVLFTNWPGDRDGSGMYVLCLLVVAVLATLAEVLSAASRGLSRRRSRDSNALGAILMTGIHAVKMGLLYLVMLAVMSFNGGVFIAVLAGHGAGFLLSRRGMLGPAATSEDVHNNGALSPSEPKP
ncbi:unnamed protein product [Urochloa humidicola]